MSNPLSKSQLAIALSKLKVFKNPQVSLEQYPTDSEIAAHVLWQAAMQGEIEGKTIVDLGCGTGILSLGCLLLGAQKVVAIDIDQKALDILRSNLAKVKSEYSIEGICEIIHQDIAGISTKADLVVTNPPFGVKVRKADTGFLEKAFTIAPITYSFHKSETLPFIASFVEKHRRTITHQWNVEFPLKATQQFHRRRVHRISCVILRTEKQ